MLITKKKGGIRRESLLSLLSIMTERDKQFLKLPQKGRIGCAFGRNFEKTSKYEEK